MIAKLRHPNIVTLYDSGVTTDGRHYFAMEYVRGVTLDTYVRKSITASSASGSEDQTIRLRNLDTRRCTQVLTGHSRAVRSFSLYHGRKPTLQQGRGYVGHDPGDAGRDADQWKPLQ